MRPQFSTSTSVSNPTLDLVDQLHFLIAPNFPEFTLLEIVDQSYDRQTLPVLMTLPGSSVVFCSGDSAMDKPETRAGETPSARTSEGDVDRQGTPLESRAERLTRIRREIELGIYDTPERFDAALDRMIERLSAE